MAEEKDFDLAALYEEYLVSVDEYFWRKWDEVFIKLLIEYYNQGGYGD